MADDFTMLGKPVRGPVDHVETFPAPPGCTLVRFTTDELTSMCPITGQPDIYDLLIEYEPAPPPDGRCIESKSLKHYLWRFRDRAAFAEVLVVEIADEVWRATGATRVRVVATQHVRGGLRLEATAERPTPA